MFCVETPYVCEHFHRHSLGWFYWFIYQKTFGSLLRNWGSESANNVNPRKDDLVTSFKWAAGSILLKVGPAASSQILFPNVHTNWNSDVIKIQWIITHPKLNFGGRGGAMLTPRHVENPVHRGCWKLLNPRWFGWFWQRRKPASAHRGICIEELYLLSC